MRRKIQFVLISFAVIMAASGCAEADGGSGGTQAARYKAGAYIGQGDGYSAAHPAGVPVSVRVAFSADGITGVEVTGNRESASREAVNAALTQIPQAILTRQQAEVEAISGATYTSNAIINAVKSCVTQAALAGGGYQAGDYTASAPGYHSAQNAGAPVKVRADFSDAALTGLKIISHKETASRAEVSAALTQIPQAILSRQQADVEAVSGATYTSKAIVSAVQDCVSQAANFAAAKFAAALP